MSVGVVSYAVAAGAFLILTVLLAIGWRRGQPGAWLIGASALSALWGGSGAISGALGGQFGLVVVVVDILRAGAWIGMLVAVLRAGGLADERKRLIGWLARIAVVVVVALVGLTVASAARASPLATDAEFTVWILGRIVLAVIGLTLVENLLRPLDADQRWRLKYLCFAVGGIFAYSFFSFAHALLFRTLEVGFEDARGFVNALVVPFIAVAAARNREWAIDVGVSRRTVFHTASLMGAGSYLLVMAGVGYYLRHFGGSWGPVLQILFLFGAVILLLVGLASAQVRSRVKVFLNKHFFSYNYDYREIWLGFIRTLSEQGGADRLEDRIVRAVADIMDSPDGGLWVKADDGAFHVRATRNLGAWDLPHPNRMVVPEDDPLVRFLGESGRVVVLADVAANADYYEGLVLPAWLAGAPRAWIVLPLAVDGRLIGFMVLGEPRAPRRLNWEDFDLLRTLGRQTASYLAEQAAVTALAEAREFEAFNRRFAFVVHDIKNLASQLSLVVGNAEKHGHNAEFRRDMIATIRESVGKMNRLLARLHNESAAESATVRVVPFVRAALKQWDDGPVRLRLDSGEDDLVASADADRLGTAMGHLIKNAIDAAAATEGNVTIRTERDGGRAVIEIIDTGPGMTEAFVRDELFRPFRSTKAEGYGIGVYESRELIREMGGELDVITAPRRGTTMRVSLPLAVAADRAQAAEAGIHDRG